MSIRINCPSCHARCRVRNDSLGRRIKCPKCKHAFVAATPDDDHFDITDQIEPAGEFDFANSEPAPKQKQPRSAKEWSIFFKNLMGLAILIIICAGVLTMRQRNQAALSEGDRLWKQGEHAAAVTKYKDGYFVAGERKAEILQRIVETEVERGNETEARRWIEKGVGDKIGVTYATAAAKRLLEAIQAEQTTQKNANRPNDDSAGKWYAGGTLHNKAIADWRSASAANKLATCGDFVASAWQKKLFIRELQNVMATPDTMKPFAQELAKFIDLSTEDPNLVFYKDVQEAAVTGMIMMKWLKK